MMFSNYFQGIDGVAIYPVAALLVFVPFFAGVIAVVRRMKKEHLERMSRLPLE